MKILLFIAVFIVAAFNFQLIAQNSQLTAQSSQLQRARPKNIILMIGDGMGLTQISAAMYSQNAHISLDEFPVVGLHKNYPLEDSTLITDSAAGATAFATGHKTYNAAISVLKDSTTIAKTILEEASASGLATGLVVTCSVQHATPACFIAHVKQRDNYEEIAEWFAKTPIDLVIGGGEKFFKNRKKDRRDIMAEFKNNGYVLQDQRNGTFDGIKLAPKQKNIVITADEHPKRASEGRTYLPLASSQACNFLKNKSDKGFFMMIEGSQIDWGGHANESNYIITETLDFDKAVKNVLEFAKRDGNTLVIVTADHETGGYALVDGSRMNHIEGKFTTTHHTCTMIPVFAFGPGAEMFGGTYENTAIYDKMKALFGF